MKMSLPLNALKSRKGDSENICMSSTIDKYYTRPNEEFFDSQCLAEFRSCYSIHPASRPPADSRKGKQLPRYELQIGLGYIKRKRKGKETVIRYPRFNRFKQQNYYYLSLLQLDLPLRAHYANFDDYLLKGKTGERYVLCIMIETWTRFEKNIRTS